MAMTSLIRAFIKKTASRNERNSNLDRVRARALRFESLESRELLSVAPGSEPSATYAAYESSVAPLVADVLDLSGAVLDGPDVQSSPSANTIVVTSELDVVDADDGVVTLREALADAQNGDAISFDGSLQGKTIALDSTLGQLEVNQSVTIDASSLWNEANSAPGLTVSGQGATRILYVNGELDVQINGITLTNGFVSGDNGGAIYSRYATLSLENCAIRDNTADSGGGAYSWEGATSFVNCVVSNNASNSMGGGIRSEYGETTFVGCLLANNASSNGAAINVYSGTLSLDSCVISGNSAYSEAGAIRANDETTLVNCVLTNNSASWYGGGAVFWGGAATLVNCTVANNTAGEGGGVDLSCEAVLNAYNSIIVGNSASSGADVHIYAESPDSSPVANAFNTLSSYEDWTSGANNLTYDASLPLFADATSGDYTLATDSQAIDKGDNQRVTTSVDLAGNPRIVDETVDLGAYEFQKTFQKIRLETPVLTATDATGLSITVAWDAVPNAERYSLSYKPSNETTWKGVNVGTNLSYTVGGLKLGSDYDFRVKAIGDGVNYKSVYSAVVSAKTNATPDPSETPVRLEKPVPTVTGTTGLSITVSWDAVPNAERYSFSYKPSNETTWKSVNVGTDLSHTVSGLKLDSDYDFRVKAIGDGQIFKSVYSTVVSAKTNAEPDPSEKPVPLDTPVLTVAAVGSTSLTINWSEVPNATRYSLFYKPVDKTTWTIVNAGTNLSYTITDLKLNTEYDARLKAIGDGVDYKSAYSPILRVETASVHFQLDAGAIVADQTVELYAPEGYEIYYTTDGSDPVVSPENLYSNPLTLTANASRFAADSNLINVGNYRIYDNSSLPKAVTVKAIAVASNGDATPIATRTYFFQEKESIAVVSISTDYDNLLDYNTGIMVKGAYYDAWSQTPEAASIIANKQYWDYEGNYTQKGKEWERSATIEIFDGDNYVVENCGIRLRGGTSRMYSQKPFNIYFRKDYGAKTLDYALFEDAVSIDGEVLSSYKDFMLRNGGNDTEYLKFHDALIQSLVQDLDITTQANRPAVLYLNGEYMGFYVLQEKFSDRFFADHYLVDKDNVVVIEEGAVGEGEDDDIALYEELQSFANMDLTDPEVYGAFCNAVDVESMIDYYATEIYIANGDWNFNDRGLGANVRLWRVRTPENDSYGDGKWRWVLYDTEFSSSLYNSEKTACDYNSFAAALDVDPLFASVIKNVDFYNAFVAKMESLAENNFSSANVNSALDRFSNAYKPYMSNYYKRFGDTSWAWNSNINGIRNFFANRAGYILDYVENYQP